MTRGALTSIGISAGVVAFVAFMTLLEHVTNLKGEEWLNYILPFGIASNPVLLAVLSVAALALSIFTLRIAKAA